MKLFTAKNIELYRVAISGLLVAFSVKILLELSSFRLVFFGFVVISLGFVLARSAIKHFGHKHLHAGDSAIDMIPVAVLLFANIAHPAVDGFSLAQTWKLTGVLPAVLLALSIVLHEVLRQSALVTALVVNKINWKWVVGTALLGIAIGIVASVAGANFFHKYETIADIATLFSYSFVIGEFYFLRKEHYNKYTTTLFVTGIVFGVLILKLTHAH